MRQLKYSEAIFEATQLCMEEDKDVILIGLGVPDPKGIFGTTLGLQEKFGKDRVFDAPTSESALSGIVLGASITGMRPVIVHQRVEFSLLGIEQIVNQAAKWSYQSGGMMNAPLVIRLIIGKGWGQGPQHSQSLESWFSHIPGLKVVMPATPHDAKGLLAASIRDNNPVVFLEHRWLHSSVGNVPKELYEIPIGKANVLRSGRDLSIITYSHMVPQALYCAEVLDHYGISTEVVDLRSLRPLDEETILKSVSKTGRLLALDGGWPRCGIASEIITIASTRIFNQFKSQPIRCALKDVPIPSTRSLANLVYPSVEEVISLCQISLGTNFAVSNDFLKKNQDVPEVSFMGPF